MSTLPQQRPTQGVAPELSSRCVGCGAALAPDQLFCLSCGTRRRDARIAFRDVLASEAAPVHIPVDGGGGGPVAPGSMPTGAPHGGGGHTNYTPFIATLASLLLALGLGVWIGRGQEAPAAVAAPVAAAPVAAATPTTPVDAAPAEDAASEDDDASAEDDAAADDAASTDAGATAPNPELKKMDDLSPEDYQKQSQKLPKEVGTGGAPPPKDNKPAGGGSEFETFE